MGIRAIWKKEKSVKGEKKMSRKVLFLALALSLNIVFGGCLRWFMPAAKAKTELTEEQKKKQQEEEEKKKKQEEEKKTP